MQRQTKSKPSLLITDHMFNITSKKVPQPQSGIYTYPLSSAYFSVFLNEKTNCSTMSWMHHWKSMQVYSHQVDTVKTLVWQCQTNELSGTITVQVILSNILSVWCYCFVLLLHFYFCISCDVDCNLLTDITHLLCILPSGNYSLIFI